jgi:ubiquinone/menaquinone biosynthesis C-methylase UbiE
MTDVYANIGDAERAIQERLAAVLELRAADPQQRAIVDDYLRDVDIAPAARALDVGCGTGFVTRVLAGMPTVASVTGVDLSPVFVAKARELAAAQENADFQAADARALPFSDTDFDLVVFHTTLTHVPEPERALAEAFRVMRPGGWVTVCDGDYSTLSVANGDWDPLQACIEAVKGAFINDLWVTRRMPALLRAAGFHLMKTRSHGYLQVSHPDYILSLIDRGAEALAAANRIGSELCHSLKAEARRRADADEFYGFIGFVTFHASKPATS